MPSLIDAARAVGGPGHLFYNVYRRPRLDYDEGTWTARFKKYMRVDGKKKYTTKKIRRVVVFYSCFRAHADNDAMIRTGDRGNGRAGSREECGDDPSRAAGRSNGAKKTNPARQRI